MTQNTNRRQNPNVVLGKFYTSEGDYAFSVTGYRSQYTPEQVYAFENDIDYCKVILKHLGVTIPKGMTVKVASDKKQSTAPEVPESIKNAFVAQQQQQTGAVQLY